MALSATIPASLKPLTAYLKRADELEKDSSDPDHPILAYYCRKFALIKGMKMPEGNTKEGKTFLMSIMTRLEKDKSTITLKDEEAKIVMEDFAYGVFARADDEFHAGMTNKGTAQKFYAAQTFLEVLEQFGEMDQETKEKCRFAKFQAAEILKAIKEGRPPPVGENAVRPPTESVPISSPPMTTSYDLSNATLPPPIIPQQMSIPPQFLQQQQSMQPEVHSGSQSLSQQHWQDNTIKTSQFIPPAPVTGSSHINLVSPSPSAPTYISPQISGGNPTSTDNAIKDATEFLHFAIASLKHKDVSLAKERIKEALRLLG